MCKTCSALPHNFTMMLFKVILFSFQVQFLLLGVSSNEHDIRQFFNNLLECIEQMQREADYFVGDRMHFVNTIKPYVDFCQSEKLLRIQEIEQQ